MYPGVDYCSCSHHCLVAANSSLFRGRACKISFFHISMCIGVVLIPVLFMQPLLRYLGKVSSSFLGDRLSQQVSWAPGHLQSIFSSVMFPDPSMQELYCKCNDWVLAPQGQLFCAFWPVLGFCNILYSGLIEMPPPNNLRHSNTWSPVDDIVWMV